MKKHFNVGFAFVLSLGMVACAAGETVKGPSSGGSNGSAGSTGNAGTTGGGNTSGSAGTTGAGNTTGRAGTTGTGNTTGSAGTTGTGNTTGAAGRGQAGSTGAAGITGTGTAGTTGAAGAAATSCVAGGTVPPVVPLITDFSDAAADPTNVGEFRYGGNMPSTRVQGGTSRFASGATKGTLSVAGGALTFAATVDAPSTANMYPFSGFVVYVDGPTCVNATAYTGVSFTLTGTLGTCQLVFSFGYADDLAATSDAMRGLCTAASCYPSQFMITTATTTVSFTALPVTMGVPVVAVDKGKLTGVQWQLQPASGATAGCTGSITVDNISFM
jgi:hypothetical protein